MKWEKYIYYFFNKGGIARPRPFLRGGVFLILQGSLFKKSLATVPNQGADAFHTRRNE